MKIRIRRQCVVQGIARMVGDEFDVPDEMGVRLVQMKRALDPAAEAAPSANAAAATEAPAEEVVEQATKQRRTRKSE